jgi:hypothetical protein
MSDFKGAMVDQGRYKDVKHPEIWVAKHWVLLRDDALVHQSLLVQQQLTKLSCPLYSPDPARHDFYILPQMKIQPKV